MKLKFLTLSLFLLGVLLASGVNAELPPLLKNPIPSAFRSYKEISNLSFKVPTVVDVPFSGEFIERLDFAVFDTATGAFEPYFFKNKTVENNISAVSNPETGGAGQMVDDNLQTYSEFPLPENAQGNVQITLSSLKPVTSSALTVLLENNVALPSFVEVRASVNGQSQIVVANKKMDGQTIRFPKTTSDNWVVTFTFNQPLRISELRLIQDETAQSSFRAVRFLSQPGHSYSVYFDPDRYVRIPVGELGDLSSTKEVFELSASESPTKSNPEYIIADVDKDGIPDVKDNCVDVANPDLLDVNGNGRGDVCDDFDQDGIINSKDNCPDNPNFDQKDTDGDGIGDVCDKEESRITEKYAWLPWIGIGFAGLVLVILLVLMAKTTGLKGTDSSDSILPPMT